MTILFPMPSFHLSRSCMVLQALCLESTGGVLSSISQLLMSCRMAQWWRFAGKLLVIHAIHAYKQHKIWSQTNSIRTVCCMYKSCLPPLCQQQTGDLLHNLTQQVPYIEEFYDWDWCPSRCSVPRKIPIGRLRPLIVSRQDPHARTPRHHLASPEDPADRTNKPQYDYCILDICTWIFYA